MRGYGFDEPLKILSGFLRLATSEIVIAGVVQKGRPWRTLRQGLLVNTLRFLTTAGLIEARGLPQVRLLLSLCERGQAGQK